MSRWYYQPQASDRVEPPEVETFECPVCGEEVFGGDELYFVNGEIVGCDRCISTKYVADYVEEQEYYKGE